MATIPGLQDLVWDAGAATANVIIGKTRCPFTKFAIPAVETKVEKPPEIGAPLATKRTPGRSEIADFDSEMLLTVYESTLLPSYGQHASNEIEQTILVRWFHPSIAGSLSVLIDGARSLKETLPELDGSEKAAIVKISWSAMRVWRAGRDGKWKASARIRGLPSATAQALLNL
jgi:hypothetical protein